jgi:hypothetical protein
VIHLGPPVDELAAERAAGIVGGLADGVEKALGAALDYAADFIAPPPPPTKDQVEQMQKAADERRQQEPAEREKAEQEARLQEILEEIRRADQREREEEERARYSRWSGRRINDDRDDDLRSGTRARAVAVIYKPQDRGNPAAAVPGASPREPVAQSVGNHCPAIRTAGAKTIPALARGDHPNSRQPLALPVAL